MQTAEAELGVSKTVSSFIFPLGATMNMDGTALYEGIAAIFLAYLFGIELSTTAMITVFFMAMVSSIGAPGMPSGSMAGMQMVLLGAGIPLLGIGVSAPQDEQEQKLGDALQRRKEGVERRGGEAAGAVRPRG